MGASFKLSVVIPHLNEPDNLRSCLLALDAQRADCIPFEIIVVDNGSSEMPDDACSGIRDLRLVRELVPGPGPARNCGAALAAAELVAFIDSDCVAQPGWVKSIVEFMANRPEVGIVGGDIDILIGDSRRPTAIEAYESIFSYRARLYVERYGFSATGNMAVRTRVFRAVGPFGGITTMEDTEWGQKATAQGNLIAFLPEAKVLTPSCKSYPELERRWDRHVAHEFCNVGNRLEMLRWLLASAVVAASPLGEIPKILGSDRISGLRSRALALTCLTHVRVYRARRMIDLAWSGQSTALVEKWNREKC
jgi:glycosyltransferase involved in cell wall biosynthesis